MSKPSTVYVAEATLSGGAVVRACFKSTHAAWEYLKLISDKSKQSVHCRLHKVDYFNL